MLNEIVQPFSTVATSHDQPYPPLEKITRTALTTEQAAFYLNRKPQTLRSWASAGTGPISPVNIHGRLSWSVEEIRTLLRGE